MHLPILVIRELEDTFFSIFRSNSTSAFSMFGATCLMSLQPTIAEMHKFISHNGNKKVHSILWLKKREKRYSGYCGKKMEEHKY